MRINGIIWLRNVVDKLSSKHRVETEEVEQVFENQPKFRFLEKGERSGEDVYTALGQSNGGPLFGSYVYLQEKQRCFDSKRQGYGAKRKEIVWQEVNLGKT